MSCSNGQCGIGRTVEFIGGPVDGYVDNNILFPTDIIIIFQSENTRRASIYQLDESGTRYLFRNEVVRL